MARRTQIVLTDDLDGGEATETVRFALDGNFYEIDLSAKNASKLRSNLERYVGAARKTGRDNATSPRVRRRARGTHADAVQVDPKAVRAWAHTNGIEVSSRGRIPESLVVQFRDAGN